MIKLVIGGYGVYWEFGGKYVRECECKIYGLEWFGRFYGIGKYENGKWGLYVWRG